MEVNTEKVMVLLQRRYNAVRELDRLTKELEQCIGRNDSISAAMVLQLRGEEMGKIEACMEEIWQMGESSRENYEYLQGLVASELGEAQGKTPEEKKIFEIRRKTEDVLEGLREMDERLNRKLAMGKAHYKNQTAAR